MNLNPGFFFWLSWSLWVGDHDQVLLFKSKFDDNPGPVLGLVRISGRVKGKDKRQILDDSFLDTFKINLGVSISPVYDPDIKKFFILMVNCIIKSMSSQCSIFLFLIMTLCFQCFFYGFLVSNIYKSSLVAHLTSPSYSKTVSLKGMFSS